MRRVYEIDTLSDAQRGSPEAQKDQLLALLYQVQEREPEWLESEASAALEGVLDVGGWLLTLDRLSPERLAKLWQNKFPQLPLSRLHLLDPLEVVRAALNLLSPP